MTQWISTGILLALLAAFHSAGLVIDRGGDLRTPVFTPEPEPAPPPEKQRVASFTYFWMAGCHWCEKMEPEIGSLEKLGYKVDRVKNGARVYPTTDVYRDGEHRQRVEGWTSHEDLINYAR